MATADPADLLAQTMDLTLLKGKRPIILCFIDYYLPGYRMGGPVRTIANLVDHLGDAFDIRIVTRDRDIQDPVPYAEIQVNAWNSMGKATVFYASEHLLTLHPLARLLRETPHDLLYLNSFFTPRFTLLPLMALRLGLAPKKSIVIAPRGEFSKGALALKSIKKRFFISLSRRIGLYRDLNWQASSDIEKRDIQREMKNTAKNIYVAPNLPQKIDPAQFFVAQWHPKSSGVLKIVFLSRISPMKNLDFLLMAMRKVRRPIHLTICGPIGQDGYWANCLALIQTLPRHINVEYVGEIPPAKVRETFEKFDLSVLPTRGENYGHVILESLCGGTPILISDKTPWRADDRHAISVLPIDDPQRWADEMDSWAELDGDALRNRRQAALELAAGLIDNSLAIEKSRSLFLNALAGDQFNCRAE